MGGVVSRTPLKEIGWGPVSTLDHPEAKRWFGDFREFEAYHWHGETFSIPPGALNIASSEHCLHQAFSLGKHLGMQFHVEMTPQIIRSLCTEWHKEVSALSARTPSVQPPEEMLRDVVQRSRRLNGVAKQIYDRWLQGVNPSN